MNLELILACFRQYLLSLGETYPDIVAANILMPNQYSEEGQKRLLIELSALVESTESHTETERVIRLVIRHTVSVPQNSGTERLFGICAAIVRLWTEDLPERSGFSPGRGQNLFVRSVAQHQGEAFQDACKASVDISIDFYEQGE